MQNNYIGAILIVVIFGSIWIYAMQMKEMLHEQPVYIESTR